MPCFALICLLILVLVSVQKKGTQNRNIARSLSVPVNNKEKSLKRMDSFFRVIPSTPRVKEGDVVSIGSPTVDAGMFDWLSYFKPIEKKLS